MKNILNKLGGIFGNNINEKRRPGWNRLEDGSKLEELEEASVLKYQLIYKHSNRCGTSFFALQSLQHIPETRSENIDFHIVDVIGNREVSQQIADYFEVPHESPQVILLKNGKVIWNGSHGEVRNENILSVTE